jgi:hypothetical protein
VVLAGTRHHDERIDYVAARNSPFVALGRSEMGGGHAWVDLDFKSAAEEGVARLVELGHRRIAPGISDNDAMQAHVYLRARGHRSDSPIVRERKGVYLLFICRPHKGRERSNGLVQSETSYPLEDHLIRYG